MAARKRPRLFRRRDPNPAAVRAIENAQQALERTTAAAERARTQNDRLERRIQQNHFGEGIAAAWVLARGEARA